MNCQGPEDTARPDHPCPCSGALLALPTAQDSISAPRAISSCPRDTAAGPLSTFPQPTKPGPCPDPASAHPCPQGSAVCPGLPPASPRCPAPGGGGGGNGTGPALLAPSRGATISPGSLVSCQPFPHPGSNALVHFVVIDQWNHSSFAHSWLGRPWNLHQGQTACWPTQPFPQMATMSSGDLLASRSSVLLFLPLRQPQKRPYHMLMALQWKKYFI